jgi:serine protease Do
MDDKRVIKTIKKVMPAVVSIAIAQKLEDLEKEIPKEFYPSIPGDGPTRNAGDSVSNGASTKKLAQKSHIPASLVDSHGMVQTGGGSGFIVASNGLILTNKHVVSEKKAEYTVILSDGRTFPARILSRDPLNDVAILKIEVNESLPCVKLGDANKLQLGQSLIAIGNALGIFRNTVSVGIVSGLSRSITAQSEPGAPPQEMRGLIQTDAAINPGNSGGPIVDSDGYVVGVNAAIVSGAQSIGFAIPVNAARRDIDDIKKYGRIRRPLLGLRYIMIDKDFQQKMNLSVDYGALVMRESQQDSAVVPESPAEKAGVQEKDIVLEFNGKKLDREHPVVDFLENSNVGDEVELLVLRNGKQITLKTILEERI